MAIPNRGSELLGVNVAFLATAVIANTLRCYVRLRMVKAFGLDDWLMVGSTVSSPSPPHHVSPLIRPSYSSPDTWFPLP
jgi:hypothetical protein